MTLQSLYVLHCLRFCTRCDGTPVYLDFSERRFMESEPDDWNRRRFKARTMPMLLSHSALDSALAYLCESGLIGETSEYITLTHSGFHFRQTIFFNALTFLMHSVLLPIIVAFLTSLAVHYFGSLFGFPPEWFSA